MLYEIEAFKEQEDVLGPLAARSVRHLEARIRKKGRGPEPLPSLLASLLELAHGDRNDRLKAITALSRYEAAGQSTATSEVNGHVAALASAVWLRFERSVASASVSVQFKSWPALLIDEANFRALVQHSASEKPRAVEFQKKRGASKTFALLVALGKAHLAGRGVRPGAIPGIRYLHRHMKTMQLGALVAYDKTENCWRLAVAEFKFGSVSPA